MEELIRHIDWLEYDNQIKWMVIRSKEASIFSKGFDFTTFFHNLRNNEPEKIVQYLQTIQKMAVAFASINKPTVSHIKGKLSNISST